MSPGELILLGQLTIYSYNFKSNLKADLIANISVKFFIKQQINIHNLCCNAKSVAFIKAFNLFALPLRY